MGACGEGKGEMANEQTTWPPSPHLLFLLFLFFLHSLPSLCCRPPPSATLRCIRISLSYPAANLCRPVLSVPTSDQRFACFGGAQISRAQLLILLSISISREHPFSCSTLLLQALSLEHEHEHDLDLNLICLLCLLCLLYLLDLLSSD